MMIQKKKVVIVGGGFAGVQIAKSLDTKLFDILLIDKLNHHQFQPLFYQVATSQIEPSSISFPLRNVFKRSKNIKIRMGEVTEIITESKLLKTSIGDYTYDYLILAMGCKTNFFGNAAIEKYAYTLKTTYDSIELRNDILTIFEKTITATEEEKIQLMDLVIVGAGPTGVELAGAYAEIKKHILPKDYPGIDFERFTIHLIEGSSSPLKSMSENAQKASAKYLKEMGVTLVTNTTVESYDGKTAVLSNGEKIATATLIWAAGVIGNKIKGLPEALFNRGNRLSVNRQNKLENSEDIYVLGDLAHMVTEKYPNGHPQLANVAINQAKLLAKNLKLKAKGKAQKEYEYRDLGSMATIGNNKAVVDLPFWKFKGFFAWLIWMFLHLMLILSVRSKLIIFINWAWKYATKNTSIRLILSPDRKR